MLNFMQKKVTAKELHKNLDLLELSQEQMLSDLEFRKRQLEHALNVTGETNGYDVWKLRDYMVDKLTEQGTDGYPYSVLQSNIWYQYDKTW